jgi:PAS domain S-box-containing protein
MPPATSIPGGTNGLFNRPKLFFMISRGTKRERSTFRKNLANHASRSTTINQKQNKNARILGTIGRVFPLTIRKKGWRDDEFPFSMAVRRMRRLSLIYIFSIGVVLLLVTIAVMYEVGVVVLQDQAAMAGELQALNDLADLASTLKDAETGQRGYLLTGEDPYLQPYRSGLAEVNERLAAVEKDAAAGTISADKLESINNLVRQKLDEMEKTVQLRRQKGLGPALAVVKDNTGKQLMDEFRSEMAKVHSSTQAKFDAAEKEASRMTSGRTTVFVIGGLMNLVCWIWSFRTIGTEMRRRQEASDETARQKEFLATTLASIGDAVILTNEAGKVTFLNREAERLTGWSNADAVARPLPEVFKIVNEETRQPVENPVDKVLRLGTVVGLANHTVLLAQGGVEFPIDDSAAPIRDGTGKLFGTVLVFRDFTEQKKVQAALSRSNEQLEKLVEERTVKLREMVAELQQVSYAISHDMRAPLRAMSGFATILQEETAKFDAPVLKDYANRIALAAARLDRLIQDALHYTKATLQKVPMGPVDLDALVRGLIESYPNLQPDKADIVIDGRLPAVLGNEALLTQCFSNLLGNAVKFVAPGARPKIRVHSSANRQMAVIRVADNGIGIPPNAHPRLFKMFERVAGNYEGTGIGLAIVRKVVERMGGQTGVKSEPGNGSEFWVELPLARAAG